MAQAIVTRELVEEVISSVKHKGFRIFLNDNFETVKQLCHQYLEFMREHKDEGLGIGISMIKSPYMATLKQLNRDYVTVAGLDWMEWLMSQDHMQSGLGISTTLGCAYMDEVLAA